MSGRQRIAAATFLALVLGGLVLVAVLRGADDAVPVRVEPVERRDLVATVTASGTVRARRSVDVSSDVMGRVVELAVEEGERVEAGQVLLRLDPAQPRAALARARAALSQARAEVARLEAGLARAQREHGRVHDLWSRDSTLVSRQQLEEARTELEVARAELTAARHGAEQAEAGLEEAEDQLARTVLRAPIGGKVTRLEIEEGETAVVGTMNNPGSLLLTISDLSRAEAVLEVDETEVTEISEGDSAWVEIDAFPQKRFRGVVTRIGESAVRPVAPPGAGGSSAAVHFEVVVTLEEPPPRLRPDLSATADIVTAVRRNALSVPILALTVREEERPAEGTPASDAAGEGGARAADSEEDAGSRPPWSSRASDREGVFVVRDGRARFTPVRVGIAGEEHFEVVSGLTEGDTVVAGPYAEIRGLEDGDPVRALPDDGGASE